MTMKLFIYISGQTGIVAAYVKIPFYKKKRFSKSFLFFIYIFSKKVFINYFDTFYLTHSYQTY